VFLNVAGHNLKSQLKLASWMDDEKANGRSVLNERSDPNFANEARPGMSVL